MTYNVNFPTSFNFPIVSTLFWKMDLLQYNKFIMSNIVEEVPNETFATMKHLFKISREFSRQTQDR